MTAEEALEYLTAAIPPVLRRVLPSNNLARATGSTVAYLAMEGTLVRLA